MNLRRLALTGLLLAALSLSACGSRPKAAAPSTTSTSTTSTTTAAATAGLTDMQPVTVTGQPLPAEYGDASGVDLNLAQGSQAPDVHGKSFTGARVGITNDSKAKVLIISAFWSPHTQRSFPALATWLKANVSATKNVSIYTISTADKLVTGESTDYATPSAFFTAINWPGDVLADNANNDAATAYGAGAYPYFVVLDSQNKVVTRSSGETTPAQLATMVQQAQSD